MQGVSRKWDFKYIKKKTSLFPDCNWSNNIYLSASPKDRCGFKPNDFKILLLDTCKEVPTSKYAHGNKSLEYSILSWLLFFRHVAESFQGTQRKDVCHKWVESTMTLCDLDNKIIHFSLSNNNISGNASTQSNDLPWSCKSWLSNVL